MLKFIAPTLLLFGATTAFVLTDLSRRVSHRVGVVELAADEPDFAQGGVLRNSPQARVKIQTVLASTDRLDAVLSKSYIHGIPFDEVEAALDSTDAAKRLTKVLAHWERRSTWENATILLGLSGSKSAVVDLTNFFFRDDSEKAVYDRCKVRQCLLTFSSSPSPLTGDEVYFAKTNVPLALGLWTAQKGGESDQSSFEFLAACSVPSSKFFQEVRWRADRYNGNPNMMFGDLSLQCIEGLGVSGGGRARIKLQSLLNKVKSEPKAVLPADLVTADAGYPKSYASALSAAIVTNERVRADGLRSLYFSNK